MDILTLLLAGAGIWFLVEGALYALAPGLVRRLAEALLSMPTRDVAMGGAFTAALGVLLIWLAVRAA